MQSHSCLQVDQVLSVSWDKTARIWNASHGKEIARFEGSQERLSHLSLSSDGQRFLTSGKDNTVRLWDIPSHKLISSLETKSRGPITGIALFPGGQKFILTDGSELRARQWETEKNGIRGGVVDACEPPWHSLPMERRRLSALEWINTTHLKCVGPPRGLNLP